jgi:hypothetical protein
MDVSARDSKWLDFGEACILFLNLVSIDQNQDLPQNSQFCVADEVFATNRVAGLQWRSGTESAL